MYNCRSIFFFLKCSACIVLDVCSHSIFFFFFLSCPSSLMDSSGKLGTRIDDTETCSSALRCTAKKLVKHRPVVLCERDGAPLPSESHCTTSGQRPVKVFLRGGQFVLLWVMNSLVRWGIRA